MAPDDFKNLGLVFKEDQKDNKSSGPEATKETDRKS